MLDLYFMSILRAVCFSLLEYMHTKSVPPAVNGQEISSCVMWKGDGQM